ncbi:MAG: peptide deformylase [bacterium]|nr:peptide deformylase [bacterium]
MLKIISSPNPVLSQKAKEVKKIDKSILNFLKAMNHALLSAKDPIGVGLAAPQVGESLQIFITKPTSKSPIQVFINPRKISVDEKQIFADVKSAKSSTKLEGCLSLQSIWGEVKRAPSIKISYMDENGKKYSKEFKGFMATIIQHEMDHLDGILFPKRVLEQKGILYKSEKNEKGEDVFEEIEL